MEISAKRPAPFLRQVVPVRKPVSEEKLQITLSSSLLFETLILSLFLFFTQTLRDPRFDDLSGEYKPEIFEKTYKFINDIKHREKEVREAAS